MQITEQRIAELLDPYWDRDLAACIRDTASEASDSGLLRAGLRCDRAWFVEVLTEPLVAIASEAAPSATDQQVQAFLECAHGWMAARADEELEAIFASMREPDGFAFQAGEQLVFECGGPLRTAQAIVGGPSASDVIETVTAQVGGADAWFDIERDALTLLLGFDSLGVRREELIVAAAPEPSSGWVVSAALMFDQSETDRALVEQTLAALVGAFGLPVDAGIESLLSGTGTYEAEAVSICSGSEADVVVVLIVASSVGCDP